MDTIAYTLMNNGGMSLRDAYGLTDYTPTPMNDIFDYEDE